MNKLTFIVLAIAVLVPTRAYASGRLEPASFGHETIADVLTSWQRANESRAAVIGVDWETYAFLIPAAGSVQGNFGTYFRSDVTLANRKTTPQIVSLAWIARGVNNGASQVQSFTIPANTTVMEADFVSRILGKTGLGSIVVVARDSAGGIDTAARIDGFSRIWSTQPGSAGTVSQNFPPVDTEDSLATSYGYGMRQDAQFRSNAGFVNLYGAGQSFTVAVVGVNGTTSFQVAVQPYSMEQVALPSGNWGDLYIRVSSGANLNWWSAYGTSVDNITGDGWVTHVH
jgi:hypothetical protein